MRRLRLVLREPPQRFGVLELAREASRHLDDAVDTGRVALRQRQVDDVAAERGQHVADEVVATADGAVERRAADGELAGEDVHVERAPVQEVPRAAVHGRRMGEDPHGAHGAGPVPSSCDDRLTILTGPSTGGASVAMMRVLQVYQMRMTQFQRSMTRDGHRLSRPTRRC